MNCKEFDLTVGDLADEKLIEASKYKIALAHKDSCARCAARLANERSLTKALQVAASAETEQASALTKAVLLKAFAERMPASPAPRILSVVEKAEPVAPSAEATPINKVFDISAAREKTRNLLRWVWAAAAAALIALLTIAAMNLLPSRKAMPNQDAKGEQPKTVQPKEERNPQNENLPVPNQQNQEPQNKLGNATAPKSLKRTTPRNEQLAANHPRVIRNSNDNEVTTDYIPLSYVSDATAMGSGHVVRMMVSRSTLISMGLPLNIDRDKEMVKADVVVSDDGLARAIRFVYSGNQYKNR